MNGFKLYPCTKSGKMLKGFCMTICDDPADVLATVAGWRRFSEKFGIKYYCMNGKIFPLTK